MKHKEVQTATFEKKMKLRMIDYQFREIRVRKSNLLDFYWD